jgi:hypothetical protein
LPLEPKSNGQMKVTGDFLTTRMDDDAIRNKFNSYVHQFSPYVVGVNNHMGSAFTVQTDKMDVLLAEIKNKRLFFVDSCTAPGSVGYREAQKLGVRTAKRDLFLDNDESRDKIIEELGQLKRLAFEKGQAIAICHAHRVTLKVLEENLPKIQQEGCRFVFVSQMTR